MSAKKPVPVPVPVKEPVSGNLLGLISAVKTFDRVSNNYAKLSATQRISSGEEHNYNRTKDQLELMINGMIDHRVRTLLEPAIKKALSEFLDQDFQDIIEDKVSELVKVKLAPMKALPPNGG